MIKQMMDEFSLLLLSDRKDAVKYSLNESVSLLPKEHYTCTGEYRYGTRLIKSDPLFIHIECGELIIKQAGLTQSSSFLLSCRPGNVMTSSSFIRLHYTFHVQWPYLDTYGISFI